jgi:hypothetical protein
MMRNTINQKTIEGLKENYAVWLKEAQKILVKNEENSASKGNAAKLELEPGNIAQAHLKKPE